MNEKDFSFETLFQYYSELFVRKLNEALQKSHHTQSSLAKLLNRSPNAVFKWTKGLNIPSHVIEKILCDIFEVDQRFFSDQQMSFEEAQELKRSGRDTIKYLREKVDALERHIQQGGEPSSEDPKKRIIKIVEAITNKNAEKFLPLIESIYEDIR